MNFSSRILRCFFALIFSLSTGIAICQPAGDNAETNSPYPIGSLQQRLNWNLNNSVGSYDKVGHKNEKWDEAARLALRAFATNCCLSLIPSFQDLSHYDDIVRTNAERAIAAGCDDPMIEYLAAKYIYADSDRAKAMLKMANDLHASQYPDLRKAYAWLRAAQALAPFNKPIQIAPQKFKYQRTPELTSCMNNCICCFHSALQSKWLPPSEIQDFCFEIFDDHYDIWNREVREGFWQRIEESAFKDRSSNAVPWLLKGAGYINSAWVSRTGAFASNVKDEQWQAFHEKLKAAQESLVRAWELDSKNPHTALQMMKVELGQGEGRERMELWFNRVMTIDPNNYDACILMRYYLEPKWYGSEEDMLAFGRKCVNSTQWGGSVPFIMIAIHETIAGYLDASEQADYWKKPSAWADIDAAYKKFFKVNPTKTTVPFYLSDYAKLAYRCERWDELNELIPKLGESSYEYLGGKEAYEKMVRLAKEHVRHALPNSAK
jgi:hypothetical protein